MPNVLPTIPNDPPQGIQALLDKVYLWNQDAANNLIIRINELLKEIEEAGGAVASVNGQTGEVVLTAEDIKATFAGEEESVQVAIDTLKTDQGDLGDQVSAIESKIPADASESNQLVTNVDLGGYLPTAGGEMTGLLTLNAAQKAISSFDSVSLLRIKAETEDGSIQLDKTFTITPNGQLFLKGIHITCDGITPYGYYGALGNNFNPWATVYTTKLNNGADLAIPTEGGTLARVEDITAAVGDISTALTSILGE